jgi:sensor domain CHASE-containing protein
MSLRQLSIQWKITLLAGLCLAGIVTLLVGLSLYRMEHSSEQSLEHGDADRSRPGAHRVPR